MSREEIEACWCDPRNRRWGVYYCKADPRIIVPKNPKWMGWTINAARPAAIPITILLLLLAVGPVLAVMALNSGVMAVVVTEAISIMVLCAVCAWFASRY